MFKVYKIIFLILCFTALAVDKPQNDAKAWSIYDHIQKKSYRSDFEIKYYDDKHMAFDYQNGTVYWFNDGSSKITISTPTTQILGYDKSIIKNYMPELNKVSISKFNGNQNNCIFELLMVETKQLKNIYDISQKDDHLALFPKEKSLVKSIELYYTTKNIPYRIILKDQLGFESIITLNQKKHFDKSETNIVHYPKTTEVINHVRHSII